MAQETGKVFWIGTTVEGTNEKGDWCIKDFAIMTNDSPTRVVAFSAWGSTRVAVIDSLQLGQVVMVDYRPESRQYNDRFYTDLRATRILVAQKVETHDPII